MVSQSCADACNKIKAEFYCSLIAVVRTLYNKKSCNNFFYFILVLLQLCGEL